MIANDFNRIPTLDSALKDSPAWMATDYKAMDVDWDVIGKINLSGLKSGKLI